MDLMGLGKRLRRWSALLALVALASCGGGTQIEPFEPTRLLAFGDESSVLTSTGRKYSINALNDDDTIDCATDPIWIQRVARAFGLFFDQCRGSSTATATALILAVPGGKMEDADTALTLKAQIDSIASTFTDKDLATVLVGANDVLEVYGQYPDTSRAALMSEMKARGTALGRQVNRIAQAGPAVLVVTVPDLGLTPFARAEKAANTDTDRARLLTDLTDEFNSAMRLEIINDGRLIGLVLGNELIRNMHEFPGSYGLENVTEPACLDSAALPDCTADTLVEDAESRTYLWADRTRLGPNGQVRLGIEAEERALNNPF